MRRAHFPNEQAPRANEGGKREFLRVRRARDLDILPQKERKPRLKKTILRRNRVPPQRAIVRYIRGVAPLSSRFFAYIFPPPKTTLFGERTLSGTTVPHGAQRRRKGVDFHGKGEPRFRATRREKRGKQQRSVSGFPLKQAKNKKARTAISCPSLFLFVFRLTFYLLLNCGALRALCKPYFLRSFARGSRVKKPAALSAGL